MTILSTIKAMASVVGIGIPDVVFSSSDREETELQYLANEMAVRIATAHDWTLLRTLKTMTGDGSTTAFALPSDYLRMLKKAQIWTSNLQTPLRHVVSTDEWLELQVRSYDYVIGAWTMLGGNIEIRPALASAVTAKYYYLSNLIVDPAAGDNAASFMNDSDTFRLNEQLLKLGMIWQWRANKGQPYAEDMENYERLLEQLIAQDKGSRILRIGRVRAPNDVTLAYPQAIEE